jgi:hypothetical protein
LAPWDRRHLNLGNVDLREDYMSEETRNSPLSRVRTGGRSAAPQGVVPGSMVRMTAAAQMCDDCRAMTAFQAWHDPRSDAFFQLARQLCGLWNTARRQARGHRIGDRPDPGSARRMGATTDVHLAGIDRVKYRSVLDAAGRSFGSGNLCRDSFDPRLLGWADRIRHQSG